MGKRASRVHAVAKRAGIPEEGLEVGFATRLQSEVRPHAPVLTLLERTPHEFTVVWRRPKAIDGDGDGDVAEITHYAIELATTSPSGTYYPWKELWCGAGHLAPDFHSIVLERTAAKGRDAEAIREAKAAVVARRAKLEAARSKVECSATPNRSNIALLSRREVVDRRGGQQGGGQGDQAQGDGGDGEIRKLEPRDAWWAPVAGQWSEGGTQV